MFYKTHTPLVCSPGSSAGAIQRLKQNAHGRGNGIQSEGSERFETETGIKRVI